MDNVFTDKGDGSIIINLIIEENIIKITNFNQIYSKNKNGNYIFERLYVLLNNLINNNSITREQKVVFPSGFPSGMIIPEELNNILKTDNNVGTIFDGLQNYKPQNVTLVPQNAKPRSILSRITQKFPFSRGGSKKSRKYKRKSKVYKSKRVRSRTSRYVYRK